MVILIFVISVTAAASAQVPGAIGRLFDGPFHNSPAATETVITGAPLKPYSLSLFHSLTITGNSPAAKEMEQAVREDSRGALWEETESIGGRLRYGIYELKGERQRRYILFLNTFLTGGDNATVIYLEGKATPEKIKRLINTISK